MWKLPDPSCRHRRKEGICFLTPLRSRYWWLFEEAFEHHHHKKQCVNQTLDTVFLDSS